MTPPNDTPAPAAAERSEMPTIWEDPAGKGYPCFERPMTPKEARDTIEQYGERIAALETENDRLRTALVTVKNTATVGKRGACSTRSKWATIPAATYHLVCAALSPGGGI